MDHPFLVRRFESFGNLPARFNAWFIGNAPLAMRSASVLPGTNSITR